MEAETKKAAVQMTALGRSLLAACGRMLPDQCVFMYENDRFSTRLAKGVRKLVIGCFGHDLQ